MPVFIGWVGGAQMEIVRVSVASAAVAVQTAKAALVRSLENLVMSVVLPMVDCGVFAALRPIANYMRFHTSI